MKQRLVEQFYETVMRRDAINSGKVIDYTLLDYNIRLKSTKFLHMMSKATCTLEIETLLCHLINEVKSGAETPHRASYLAGNALLTLIA